MSDLLLTFYGDDFTGSTDSLEALALAGLRAVLFLEPPTPVELARFEGVRAVGVAGSSRAMTPEQMNEALPPVYEALRDLKAPIAHYKVCSTFDSSPRVGSIGRALDLGQATFRSPFVPMVVGAPTLGRYCVFGNLFARSGLDTEPSRLDRHPTMRVHPITPMDESDLRLHLGRQTARRVELFDALKLRGSPSEIDARFDELLSSEPDALLFDTLYPEHLPIIGRLIWEAAQRRPLFSVASSGLEYALVAHWRDTGMAPPEPTPFRAESVERLVVASGSASPVTARQIDRVLASGFGETALDTASLVDPATRGPALDGAIEKARNVLSSGRSVVVHTAKGPNDPRIAETSERVASRADAARPLGEALGIILRTLLTETGLKRGVVTGGDASFHAARAMGIRALETAACIQPGSPVCRVYSDDPNVDGLEVLFKGGQAGRTDFLAQIQRGHPL